MPWDGALGEVSWSDALGMCLGEVHWSDALGCVPGECPWCVPLVSAPGETCHAHVILYCCFSARYSSFYVPGPLPQAGPGTTTPF